MKLAREGWEIVGGCLAVAIALTYWFGAIATPAWLFFLFSLQFFRDPARVINPAANAVLSPADGRVVFVGRAVAPTNGESKIKISIFMNVFNVHANRTPADGVVVHSQRFAGKFLNAALDKASEHNERHLISLKTPFGDIQCMQIAGLLARRVLCYPAVGDTLKAGQRYGFIRFGSRVDVYMPPTCNPTVAIGDKVAGGVDVIAQATGAEQTA